MFRNRLLVIVLSALVILLGLVGTRMMISAAQEEKQMKLEAEAAAALQNDLAKWKEPTHVPVKHESSKFNW